MIHIGTSGYYYKDWVGKFYPEGLKAADRLGFYAREFKTVEINSTYYHMPNARSMEGMARQVTDDFVFAVKAPQELTHQRDGDAALFVQFVDALAPLVDAGKFAAVLAQFPYSFHNTPANANYLRTLRERMGDVPVVVEFRTADWLSETARDKTFALLREQKLGFCCVDLPPIKSLPPPIAEATSTIAYVRFHGRNAAKWWEHEASYERYEYAYSQEELGEWVPKIEKLNQLAEAVFVFANNHYRGQAVDAARQLRLLLEPPA